MAYISETFLTVRYAETDQMGIVHHSRYYPWFEMARTDYIKKCGLHYRDMEAMGVLMPLLETGAKYLLPLQYEDECLVTCRMTSLRPVKCEFYYEVYKLPERTLVTTGITRHGFLDRDFKPLYLKKKHPELWQVLESLLQEEAATGEASPE